MMKFLKNKKKLNLKKTFRLLMVFLTSISHLKLLLPFLLLAIRTIKWKMMKPKKMEMKIRIKLIQLNKFSKTR